MYTGRIIFSQLMDVIPTYQFRKIVASYKGDYRVRTFTCWNQLLCLCFGQLTFRESLRDLTSTLNAIGSQRYHMGIRTEISLSTFADANANRPWQIYHQLAMVLIDQARQLYHEDSELKSVAESMYALDSTAIDLCLSLFPWAEFRKHKGAIKLHTLMDLEGAIPTFIHISDRLLVAKYHYSQGGFKCSGGSRLKEDFAKPFFAQSWHFRKFDILIYGI